LLIVAVSNIFMMYKAHIYTLGRMCWWWAEFTYTALESLASWRGEEAAVVVRSDYKEGNGGSGSWEEGGG
jgi:hypothetical protein